MKLNEFDYYLPKELIAQEPPKKRGFSRLLVVDRKKRNFEEKIFNEIIEYLEPGDLIIFNNTKVIKARLYGKLPDGREGEILLVRKIGENIWEALTRPAKKMKEGVILKINNNEIKILERKKEGVRIIQFLNTSDKEVIEKYGNIPLPPYIKNQNIEEENYQTIFASKEGAVAAPTAGFHFNEALIEEIKKKGVKIDFLTLHCSLGTFRPIKTENIEEHQMYYEEYEIPENLVRSVEETKREKKRIIACGTTVVRALESQMKEFGKLTPGYYTTNLYIYPPFQFQIVDALITNFHLPKSTLLLLVCAFADKELIFQAYQYAIERKFYFYSFGDAMFII
ncbi:MAG: tRNA preQ1(34) S-adenosylmethionine ribosyltransferase-isomerase QueA [candidate division WOR-3 bacterium]|nr:tRNA preQ1(34) S-adenosylmethionine ribosyltransferase-isomerase QueA [candidate division WOR-3 bacterium]MCX7837011.1 tRNA preQ1(34) S-adenosylmethionine ribosyltransferase-isomerase QueA [candidate division WOR-3 bacterium]MDW8114416.1 tRNA preQ1(34) S-adenosylmethionine ribosyltransferase-isomerase QueA [candidate division WOR-3 bacterium]